VSPEPADPSDPERCPPCRGTGQVISTLGGTPQQVTCPWCEGTGRRRLPEQAPAGEE
jgi:DnaJ-class molecular chaperone